MKIADLVKLNLCIHRHTLAHIYTHTKAFPYEMMINEVVSDSVLMHTQTFLGWLRRIYYRLGVGWLEREKVTMYSIRRCRSPADKRHGIRHTKKTKNVAKISSSDIRCN